jgi:extracellular factor (EF) 3-hydroxypalmitic acid methyl ester biosynthesis protein
MSTQVTQEQNAIQKLIRFIKAGGPEESAHNELTSIWNSLTVETGTTSPDVLTKDKLIDLFGQEFLNQTIQGFGYRKPHGYAGDFEMIDYIYQKKINRDERFQKWDKYLHSQEACKAVLNRKTYFIDLVKGMLSSSQSPLRILNIASGPCRDLLELFDQISTENVKITCVEIDNNASIYAKKLLGRFASAVNFIQDNIFKFDTTEKFDLVWSAGLFDYFADQDFVKLLSKAYSWCAPSGEVVVGNFSISNPSRSYMEQAAGWYLFHRTNAELMELALKAGLSDSQITVNSEALGVNLFLHVSGRKRNVTDRS